MKISIINIGDEILIGQILNTNAQWMSRIFTESGLEVEEIMVVGDEENAIKNAVQRLMKKSDVVVTTGGLGPTKDDITLHALCSFFETELVFSETVYQMILQILQSRKRTINELTKNQAMVPRDCEVILNKVGTAPITVFEKGGKILISMPGVPFEMKYNILNEIMPRLIAMNDKIAYGCRHLILKNITESALAIKLEQFENNLPVDMKLAYLPSYGYIRLRLFARSFDSIKLLDQYFDELKVLVSTELIYDKDISLSKYLLEKLETKDLKIATAESCTGGYVAHFITGEAGASVSYKGSVIAYSNEIKTNILKVPSEILKKFGAVSQETVESMAKNLQKLFKTEATIAISGIAGPEGGDEDKPVGTVWICTCVNDKMTSRCYLFGRERETNIMLASHASIIQLLELI